MEKSSTASKQKAGAKTAQRRRPAKREAGSKQKAAAMRPGTSRKFRLHGDEPLPEGVRRIIEGQIDAAVDHLAQRDGEPLDEAVHEARKAFKRVRAALRLVRRGLSPSVFQRENARFRELGSDLSGARDADVVVEALSQLTDHFASDVSGNEITVLPERLLAERAERHKQLASGSSQRKDVAERLLLARPAAEGLTIDSDPWAVLGGLRRTYRAGRQALAAARKNGDDETLHEWRKRAKDLWHQLQILESVWPKPMRAASSEAHTLAELLGQDHDLVVLSGKVFEKRDQIPEAEHDLVSALIERRRRELQSEAKHLGSLIYAERPKQFASRIGAYLDAWAAGVPEQAEPLQR